MEMDQDTARQLLMDGGTLLFLDVPRGTEFGVDMKSWNTDSNFKGVKMIPPGLHYIHYSSVSKTGETAPRIGFIHNFSQGEFLVMKWDDKTEDIAAQSPSQEEVERLQLNLKNLDRYLGPYPYDIFDKWKALTSYVTETLVLKLQPVSGQIRSALELVSCKNADRPKGTSDEASTSSPQTTRTRRSRPGIENIDDELLPDLKPVPGTELRLTSFPENNYPDGSTPNEITKYSLDSSYVLEYLIKENSRPIDLLGELQFSFICFLIGHSLEAFEHWKRLVHVICSCDEAITKYRLVFDCFITAFEAQLIEVPEEFLADIVANNNFVYRKLRDLFRAIKNSSVDGRLKSKAERFMEKLAKTHEWDFTDLEEEDEEDAPVIVKL